MEKNTYDIIVIGAGHAGIEASCAGARLGKKVLLATIDINSVSYMACNPSIGGVGKSHLVYEIDAMDGMMGVIGDRCCIQMRTLNASNGHAVRALRAQIDKHDYHKTMLDEIQKIKNITLKECEIAKILTGLRSGDCFEIRNKNFTQPPLADPCVIGVETTKGERFYAKSVVVATGVYLNSCVLVGHTSRPSGPVGFAPATELTKSLVDLGIRVRRFKTGTPPRVKSESIDYTKTEPQPPDTDAHFSTLTTAPTRNLVSCHLTYTNEQTHKIIRDNIKKSAMYGGLIKGVGARYCPSIEDKITRFASANRHQVFLEPESLSTDEIYLQGVSTSLPADIQKEFVQTIAGLENAEILRSAYAIEYDCIDSLQLDHNLQCKTVRGLYFAGQVNGTSGYEEAGAQGIVAGANAGLNLDGKALNLSRTNSYIGVLVDDLVTLGTNEPYRMFTSRAEHRLLLRRDNADQRLTPLARELGLVGDERWKSFEKKAKMLELARKNPSDPTIPSDIREIIEIEKVYEGYARRESVRIEETKRQEQTAIPADIDYNKITALRRESQIKLGNVRPQTIAQAMRISGVTPADINVLLVWISQKKPPLKPLK